VGVALSAYESAVEEIIKSYRMVSDSIDLKKLFDSEDSQNFIPKLLISHQLHKIIIIINTHLNNELECLKRAKPGVMKKIGKILISEETITAKFIVELNMKILQIKRFNF
jgi:hypothetical protein